VKAAAGFGGVVKGVLAYLSTILRNKKAREAA